MCRELDAATRREVITCAGLAAGAIAMPSMLRAEEKKSLPTRVMDTPNVDHDFITISHAGGAELRAFASFPKGAAACPAVVVVPGREIAEEYIQNTCVALSLAGYAAVAPEIFHPEAKSAAHGQSAFLDDIQSAASYLREHPRVRGGIGVLGFCFGGKLALLFGARSHEVDAVVAFHPAPTLIATLERLTAPVLIHHGTGDKQVEYGSSRLLERSMLDAGKAVHLEEYRGADHGFLAYTRPTYSPDDAVYAWERTIEFLKLYVKGN